MAKYSLNSIENHTIFFSAYSFFFVISVLSAYVYVFCAQNFNFHILC